MNKRNLALIDQFVIPDYVDHTSQIQDTGMLKQFYNRVFEDFPDFHRTIEDIIAEGDKVSVRSTITGTTKTGKKRARINDAEKGSRNRTVKVPEKTIAMINALRRKNTPYIFNTKPCNVRVIFQNLRRRLATTQNNPRFRRIHLHTFRHFYATETLRNTKSLDYAKYALGHKSIMNTERYTHIVNFETGRYYSATANTLEEGLKLAEGGWTYFETFDGVKVFRKPRY